MFCTESCPFVLPDLLVLQASVHWKQQSRMSEKAWCLLLDILQNFGDVYVEVLLVFQGFILRSCSLLVKRDFLATLNRSPKTILEDLRE
jgi:hypothetical protein